ncbi:hypothetical protein AQZ52_00030 [Novosphingobium fuchskuhlense]|uniref:Uncharacterized protein n=1 Tax=Novosphingobium fuchskuhlense TaxID=1117702 RepID=A0A117UZ02_9SPHN|nr:hypothetical protein [Novosphingobium fuchskuhlense]KUR73420.1 hypothetical protein AQZ52_00030 [Novosphingobium fuchskuhlense]
MSAVFCSPHRLENYQSKNAALDFGQRVLGKRSVQSCGCRNNRRPPSRANLLCLSHAAWKTALVWRSPRNRAGHAGVAQHAAIIAAEFGQNLLAARFPIRAQGAGLRAVEVVPQQIWLILAIEQPDK